MTKYRMLKLNSSSIDEAHQTPPRHLQQTQRAVVLIVHCSIDAAAAFGPILLT